MSTSELGWAPDACTLPTVERPLRAAEFDELFAGSVRAVDRLDPRRVRLTLSDPGPVERLAARVTELTVRESQCCSFFQFAVRVEGAAVVLDIEVPESYVDVLEGLSQRAIRLSA